MNGTTADWATACAQIMTSPGSRAEDVATCRGLMAEHHDVSWPLAFALVGVALAAAYGIPHTIRALWD
jgi:hypothetical protein